MIGLVGLLPYTLAALALLYLFGKYGGGGKGAAGSVSNAIDNVAQSGSDVTKAVGELLKITLGIGLLEELRRAKGKEFGNASKKVVDLLDVFAQAVAVAGFEARVYPEAGAIPDQWLSNYVPGVYHIVSVSPDGTIVAMDRLGIKFPSPVGKAAIALNDTDYATGDDDGNSRNMIGDWYAPRRLSQALNRLCKQIPGWTPFIVIGLCRPKEYVTADVPGAPPGDKRQWSKLWTHYLVVDATSAQRLHDLAVGFIRHPDFWSAATVIAYPTGDPNGGAWGPLA